MWRAMPFLLVAAGAGLLPSLAPAWIAPASVMLVYILVGTAASLEFGWAGLPDFTIAAWFFAGAYFAAPLLHGLGLALWACLALCAAAITVIALTMTSLFLRLPREDFAMLTLSIALIVPNVITHQGLFTVSIIAVPAANITELYDVLIAMVLIAGAVAVSIERSPLGLALRASAEDETVCRSIGLHTRRCKLMVVAISACTAATAGFMLPSLQGFLNPADTGFGTVASIFAIAIIAGRRMSAAVVPTLAIAGIPQLFPALSEYRVILAGAVLLGCALWRAIPPSRGGDTATESFNLARPTEASAE